MTAEIAVQRSQSDLTPSFLTRNPEVFDFLCSTSTSGAVKILFAPVERIKLLKNVEPELIRTGKLNKGWNSYWDLITRTIKYEGLRSFWKGNGTYVLRYTLSQGIALTSKDSLYRRDPLGNIIGQSKVVKKIFYGGLGGAIGLGVAYPLEVARTRITNDIALHQGKNSVKEFSGVWSTIRKTAKADGWIRGLWKGYSLSFPMVFVYRGVQFGVYDNFKDNPSIQKTWITVFMLSYASTVAGNICMYPLNTCRTRMVMTTGENKTYKGWPQQFKYIWVHEGARAFYKGFAANMVKSFGSASVLFVYDRWTKT